MKKIFVMKKNALNKSNFILMYTHIAYKSNLMKLKIEKMQK